MYICIDIGGTKTLVARLTNEGVVSESVKFPTPKDYDEFLSALKQAVSNFKDQEFRAGTVAVPGSVDRKKEIGILLPNLGWKNLPRLKDIERITRCPMVIENDAKLAGLSESMLLKGKFSRVLYVTVSTGIGVGLTVDGHIDTSVSDGGGHTILVEHKGKLTPWEDFASGKAIVKKYGKQASEIHDPATWRAIARNLAPGFLELIAVLEPQVIVVGGGAGHYLERFQEFLVADLEKYETPMMKIPPILPAQRPDEAVIYGCYDYAQQKFA